MSAATPAVAVIEAGAASGAALVCCPACAQGFHDQPGAGPCACACHGSQPAARAACRRKTEVGPPVPNCRHFSKLCAT
jgi:hypothetical protein